MIVWAKHKSSNHKVLTVYTFVTSHVTVWLERISGKMKLNELKKDLKKKKKKPALPKCLA